MKEIDGICGEVCGNACAPKVVIAPILKSPMNGPPVSEKAKLNPNRKNCTVTMAMASMHSIIRDKELLYLDSPE